MAPKTRGKHLHPGFIRAIRRAMNRHIHAPSELDCDTAFGLLMLAAVSLASGILSFLDVFDHGVPLGYLFLASFLTCVAVMLLEEHILCSRIRLSSKVVVIVFMKTYFVTVALAAAALLNATVSWVWNAITRLLTQTVAAVAHLVVRVVVAVAHPVVLVMDAVGHLGPQEQPVAITSVDYMLRATLVQASFIWWIWYVTPSYRTIFFVGVFVGIYSLGLYNLAALDVLKRGLEQTGGAVHPV
ncbi:hypothetical protein NKR19_g9329 [Coniochaeta hoffmannii]|uniref:Uncharacterized protein n=1 Tax=Coniochaeta hoffmannii TaxID=91930 RepID=A0AA38RB09_9PEZI|nr:hypothetical protein NKR19_g9329 [Coniochaeta hoffmannii]